jgi:uncharacterized damage-inducible protein DinB
MGKLDADNRPEPPSQGGEKETLEAFLDFHRATLLWKLSGLTDAELRQRLSPPTWPLLSLVKHLAYVERNWFRSRFIGEELAVPWTEEDPDPDFRIEPDETTASVLAFYQDECERSRDITAEASLDDLAAFWPADRDPSKRPTLRWILVHMIEETARHNGHADIVREMIDGAAGE